MPNLPVINCDNCGACCMAMGSPPAVYWHVDGKFAPDDTFPEDYEWLMSAPEEARALIVDFLDRLEENPTSEVQDAPCCWLDTETKRCRFYEHRPGICRDFEMGGVDCRRVREAVVEGAA